MFVREIKTDRLIKVFIQKIESSSIKNYTSQFGFDWHKLSKRPNSRTYGLKHKEELNEILGLLHLTTYKNMLIMNLVEVSKKNIGKRKQYDYIAGCLIAFACQESFAIESSYKGFLTFNAKSELIDLYKNKYYARQINGQRMYIEPEAGVKLIDEYINRKK